MEVITERPQTSAKKFDLWRWVGQGSHGPPGHRTQNGKSARVSLITQLAVGK